MEQPEHSPAPESLQSHDMPLRSFCVYAHRHGPIIFYIGQGGLARPFTIKDRNREWQAYVQRIGTYTIDILAYFDTKEDALREEFRLILLHAPCCNCDGNPAWRRTRTTPPPPMPAKAKTQPPVRLVPPPLGRPPTSTPLVSPLTVSSLESLVHHEVARAFKHAKDHEDMMHRLAESQAKLDVLLEQHNAPVLRTLEEQLATQPLADQIAFLHQWRHRVDRLLSVQPSVQKPGLLRRIWHALY